MLRSLQHRFISGGRPDGSLGTSSRFPHETQDMSAEDRLYVEWMLKEKFHSTAPGRPKVVDWINDNWVASKASFKGLKPKKA